MLREEKHALSHGAEDKHIDTVIILIDIIITIIIFILDTDTHTSDTHKPAFQSQWSSHKELLVNALMQMYMYMDKRTEYSL